MQVNSKELNLIATNLCLPTEVVSAILYHCKTFGEIASADLGLQNKTLEKRIKGSLITFLYKLNLQKGNK